MTIKIIHQIWLSDSIPSHIEEWQKTWQDTEYKYKLWRWKDIEEWIPDLEKGNLLDHPAPLQSDLLRLLIIQKHGGLYIDSDCKRIGPIPENMPTSLAGIWCDGPDPFFLHGKPGDEAIFSMIEYGFSKWKHAPEIYRWGFKAFHEAWKWNTLDVQSWCKHISQCSWGGFVSPKIKPIDIPPSKHIIVERTKYEI